MVLNSSLSAKASAGAMSWECCLWSSSARAAGPEGTRHLLEQTPQESLDHLLLLWADGGFSRTDFSNWVDEHSERLVEIIKLPIMLKALLSSLVAGWLSVLLVAFLASVACE